VTDASFDWEEYRDEAERATYDPTDNKIRIYVYGRVPDPMHEAFKKDGFGRAPMQGCYFQVWTPAREDVALALCDEIEDEDSTLTERAEDRHMRFAGYTDNAARRANEASQASHDAVKGIPFGQPILIGHHSEKRHRRDIERAQAAADRAVQEYDKRDYWTWRAEGVQRHAAHMLAPGTVVRRIKTLEAELRKHQRESKYKLHELQWMFEDWCRKHIEGWDYEQTWDTLDEEAKATYKIYRRERIDRKAAFRQRWIDHVEGQLSYWKSFYTEKTGKDADDRLVIKKGDWVQTKRRTGIWAQVVRVNMANGKLNSVSIDNTEMRGANWEPRIWPHEMIKAVKTDAEYRAEQPLPEPRLTPRAIHQADPEKEAAKELAKQAKEIEVAVNHDPDFYPTPPVVIDVILAQLNMSPAAPGSHHLDVLEPSAGDGRLAKALIDYLLGYDYIPWVDVCEINSEARRFLEEHDFNLVASDFMEYNPTKRYDLIVMNPPFSRNQYKHHIKHAYDLLVSGGAMITVMPGAAHVSADPFEDRLGSWVYEAEAQEHSLPHHAFKDVGTLVGTRLVSIIKP